MSVSASRFGAVDEDERRRPRCRRSPRRQASCDVQAERGRDLVVARAAGVDLAADRPEPALDRRVDVLVSAARPRPALGSRASPISTSAQLVLGQDARPRGAAGRGRASPRSRTGRSSRSSPRRNSQTSGASRAAAGPPRGQSCDRRAGETGHTARALSRALAGSRELRLERGDLDEALGRLVRERLARRRTTPASRRRARSPSAGR